MIYAHESSYIETEDIGEGTEIWHFCHIEKTAKIGKNCMIGQGCYIGECVIIGDNCRIQNGNSLFTGLILEDNIFIGPNVVFTNVIRPRVDEVHGFIRTRIQDGAVIGAGAFIRCGITIGIGAFVGMGAMILKDVPPGVTVVDKGRIL